MGISTNDLVWVIKPIYQEIVVYGETSFVAKQDDIYKVLDYNERTLHEFADKEILGIAEHSNGGGELQEIIHVNYHGNKSRLFNIKSLKYLHDNKYYLLQTEDYYEPERRLIRVFDELKEGIMDLEGNLLLPPIYDGVSATNDYSIGFNENEIKIFDNDGKLDKIISYSRLRPQHIAKRKVILIHRKIDGEPNVYKEIRNYTDGVNKIDYETLGSHKFACGIVDLKDNIVIPFDYSSLSIKDNNHIEFTKKEIITEKGVPIASLMPKRGLIDFNNNIILENKYKSIGTIEGTLIQVVDFENKIAIFNLIDKKFETDFIFNNYGEASIKISELDNSINFLEYKENDLVGMKNKAGEIIIPAIYEGYHKTINPEIYTVYGASDDEYGYEGYYHIGLKKEIVPTKYADRGGIGGHKRNNQNNVITVMDPETGKIGFYRTDGKKIADTLYDESVEAFSEDLAPVYEIYSERTGMINIEGELVYDYIFDSMTLPYNNKSIVSYRGKYGILQLKK